MYDRSLDRQLEEQRKKKRPAPPPEEEMEEELLRPAFVPLEQRKSVFDAGAVKTGGINTAPSVFEDKSVFHPEE